ncbi:MAG: Gfo/Idh/MocA family oxidoreductase [Clostridiaceae bacterium]|nr:Gfo/Idh/MocA family oxidoreductase [Clostridiaceae bacterium]
MAAVCDRHLPSLEKVKKAAADAKMDVALYPDFEDFIQHPMDAVILANYATEHATYAVRCLNLGLHVLSECLPCETMAQAVALIEAVERTGKIYAYAENCCYMTHAFEMWQKYQEGTLGEITYAEGEYIHDCTRMWPGITYGDRNHWRNRMYATFYCTHSLGPIITATGKRPVQVIGFECPRREKGFEDAAIIQGPGIEMVTLDNGAVVKSVHGGLTREGASQWNYQIYCQNGMMESGRFREQKNLHMYQEGPGVCRGTCFSVNQTSSRRKILLLSCQESCEVKIN